MKGVLAFLLVTAGTVGAAIGIAQSDPSIEGWEHTFQVNLPLTTLCLCLLIAGILLARSVRFQQPTEGGTRGSADALKRALAKVEEDLRQLEDELEELDLPQLHRRVDQIVGGPISDFVDSCEILRLQHGGQAYGKVMAPFAQAERYLNRAWSATTDGYRDEAREYVKRAVPIFREAAEEFSRL
jgi:hypothetical protein